jgi:hypothetical protein
MVTFLFTSIIILGLLSVAIYFWQKPNHKRLEGSEREPNALPPSDSRGLFAVPAADDHDDVVARQLEPQPEISATTRLSDLVARAHDDDKSALLDANTHGDKAIYEEVLTSFVEQANDAPKLLSLVSFVVGHKLPVITQLANAVTESWKTAPDRPSTARMLHIAALSDDVPTYQMAVETALRYWLSGRLSDISPVELGSLFDGEFWVLSSAARNTGAGFILKRTLASARRELKRAAHVNK